MSQTNDDPLLTENDVSSDYGIPVKTQRNWRSQKRGPSYLKIGANVRYRKSAIEKWLAECEVHLGGGAA